MQGPPVLPRGTLPVLQHYLSSLPSNFDHCDTIRVPRRDTLESVDIPHNGPASENLDDTPALVGTSTHDLTPDNLLSLERHYTTSGEETNTVNYTDNSFPYELKRRNVLLDSEMEANVKEFTDKLQPLVTQFTSSTPNEQFGLSTINEYPDFRRVRKILRNARNEGTVTSEVVPTIFPTGSLSISSEYDGISDAQWRVDQLPTLGLGENECGVRLAAPKPDATYGFKLTQREEETCSRAISFLEDTMSPVVCKRELLCPCMTVEVKGLSSRHFSVLQNAHNAAHMLKNMEKLRSTANTPGWQESFYGSVTAITACVTKESISLYGHWLTLDNDKAQYHSTLVTDWTTSSENWTDIRRYIFIAIVSILHQNREWILSDLETISKSSHIALPAPTSTSRKGTNSNVATEQKRPLSSTGSLASATKKTKRE